MSSNEQSKEPPSEAEVLRAVKNSGYPLELKVTELFHAAHYIVRPNYGYVAADGKRGEADVYAERNCDGRDQNVLHFHYVVECKARRSGVVGFETRADEDLRFTFGTPDEYFWGEPTAVVNKLPVSRDDAISGRPTAMALRWGEKAWSPSENEGTQIAGMQWNRKQAAWVLDQQSLFSDAILPLCHAVRAVKATEGTFLPSADRVYVNLIGAIVVIEGPLHVYSHGEGEEEELRPVDTFSYYRHLEESYGGGFFRIDVVRFDALEEYLARLRREEHEAAERFNSMHERLIASSGLFEG